ncbi:TPA: hypothetical protein ACX42R_000417 [Escherichia coli]
MSTIQTGITEQVIAWLFDHLPTVYAAGAAVSISALMSLYDGRTLVQTVLAHYPQQVTQYLQVNWKQHTPSVVLLLMAQRELKHYHREYLCRGRQIRRLTVTLSWWGRLLTNQHTRNLQ